MSPQTASAAGATLSSIKTLLRSAFFAMVCAAPLACGDPPATAGSTPTTAATATDAPSASAMATATTEVAARRDGAVHPVDADGNVILRRAEGTCYVQVAKKEPPPADLISGERWVDDKTVPCPKEYDESEFAAIPAGHMWGRDAKTGDCTQIPLYGDPPMPPKKVECPPSLKR